MSAKNEILEIIQKSTGTGKTLIPEGQSLGYPRADEYGHRMIVHKVEQEQLTLLDSWHPAIREDINKAQDMAPGGTPDPFVVVTAEEALDELAYMADNDQADGSEEVIKKALSDQSIANLDSDLIIRAAIRSFLGKEVVPERYLSKAEALTDVWQNNAENVGATDGYQITCPECFLVLPTRGNCDCQEY